MNYINNMDNHLIKNKTDFDRLDLLKNKSIFIELPIFTDDLTLPYNDSTINSKSINQLKIIADKVIKDTGGSSMIFVYGSPLQLIKFNEIINKKLHFHYWIALDTNGFDNENNNNLKHNHLGILLYSKDTSISNLNVKQTKFPHIGCSACGENVKDWGGKKHLMNINGTGLSDVWKDFYEIDSSKKDDLIKEITLNNLNIKKSNFNKITLECPLGVKKRVESLTNKSISFVKISNSFLNKINDFKNKDNKVKANNKQENISKGILNKVILGDCIKEMEKLLKKYPEGIFDLVFADPPYNLSKNYKEYDDTRKDKDYEEWCNKWLELSIKLTKKSGSIFVVNIPRWGLSHAKVLNKYAYLRNWIVWDALSTPKGKIMPAHYSLLYYTKEPNTSIVNNIGKVDPITYCLRASCNKNRKDNKKYIEDRKDISDIWYDLYRIKHKKDRDDHPCQLPYKLMDRIIEMSTKEGDLVFDPFGGAGTTGIVALKKKRNFTLMEIDPYYKKISERWLEDVKKNGNTTRNSIKNREKSKYTKKFLETKVQELSSSLKKKPTIEEFIKKYNLELEEIKKLYSDPKNVLKAGRISLINQKV